MIAAIAAFDENRVLGYQGHMPWHIPDDLRRFQNLTLGQSVVMGRKTYESIGKPLPGRVNYILSSTKAYEEEGIIMVSSLQEALRDSRQRRIHLYIGGGAKLYEEALPLCDFLYLTKIHHRYQGDTFFPFFNPKDYFLLLERRVSPTPSMPGYTFYTYGKK